MQEFQRHALDLNAALNAVEWHLDGDSLPHREDGPAVVFKDGCKMWFIHGKRHRLDGPALEHTTHNSWFVEDRLHRVDGPAVEYFTGGKYWALHGVLLSEETHKLFIQSGVK